MKSIFSSRRNKSPHNNEEADKQEASFFGKESKTPFFNTSNGGAVQTKLTVGQPGDKYEKEADSMADAVVNNSAPKPDVQNKEISSIQRESLATPQEDEKLGTAEQRMEEDKLVQEKPELQKMGGEEEEEGMVSKMEGEEEEEGVVSKMEGEEEEEGMVSRMEGPEEEEETLQTKSNGSTTTTSSGLTQQIKSKSGKGKTMAKNTRAEMEASFGKDFSGVNIHTDQDAVKMNKELGAQAFTHGKDVYFNSGKYNPDSTAGKHLLAHELTHVVQQKRDTIQKKEKKPKPSTTKPSKRDRLVAKLLGTMPVKPKLKAKIIDATKAFSEKQLERMTIAGVRFWKKGESPPFLQKAGIKIKSKKRGKASYFPQGRVIWVNQKSLTDDIRHELAHAWDHMINIKGKKRLAPLEAMSEKGVLKELDQKKPFRSQKNKKILKAFKAYKKRLQGDAKRASGEMKRLFTFDNPQTASGYSLSGVSEFYAEGYSVFHGPHKEKKKRLLENAPELFIFLTKEAKKYKLKVPTKDDLMAPAP